MALKKSSLLIFFFFLIIFLKFENLSSNEILVQEEDEPIPNFAVQYELLDLPQIDSQKNKDENLKNIEKKDTDKKDKNKEKQDKDKKKDKDKDNLKELSKHFLGIIKIYYKNLSLKDQKAVLINILNGMINENKTDKIFLNPQIAKNEKSKDLCIEEKKESKPQNLNKSFRIIPKLKIINIKLHKDTLNQKFKNSEIIPITIVAQKKSSEKNMSLKVFLENVKDNKLYLIESLDIYRFINKYKEGYERGEHQINWKVFDFIKSNKSQGKMPAGKYFLKVLFESDKGEKYIRYWGSSDSKANDKFYIELY